MMRFPRPEAQFLSSSGLWCAEGSSKDGLPGYPKAEEAQVD